MLVKNVYGKMKQGGRSGGVTPLGAFRGVKVRDTSLPVAE